MSDLNIIDVSAVLHSANNVSTLSEEVTRGCPVGGINLMFRKICNLIRNGDKVMCAFDSKTDRKVIMSCYKKGRKKQPKVILQEELLLKLLKDIGIACVKKDGYEADDLINSISEQYISQFDHVYIHTSDKDLAHAIVNYKVAIYPVNNTVGFITEGNFQQVLNDGIPVLFNTITLKKMLVGDSSDNVPEFISHDGVKGRVIYDKALDFIIANNLIDPFITRSLDLHEFLYALGIFSMEDKEELDKRTKIFYPRITHIEEVPTGLSEISFSRLIQINKALKNYDAVKNFAYKKTSIYESDPEIEELLFKYGNSFRSGEFHVDRNLNVNPISSEEDALINSSSVFIRTL